tara:strand:+ start:100 stop:1752 length:1653 start_codon:yes stop_codon:yes gene_type:complete
VAKETTKKEKKERRDSSHTFISTYDTKQNLPPQQIQCLDDIVRFFNQHKRHFNKKYALTSDDRKAYVKNTTFNDGQGDHPSMNYRFFQGIFQELKGMHDSIKSNRENYLFDKKDRLKEVDKEIKTLSKKYHNLINNQQKIKNHNFDEDKEKLLTILRAKHQKRNNLINAINKLKDKNNYGVCFGTKKLMKQRHQLSTQEEINEWREKWQFKRHNQCMLVGSHDETQGNMNCQVYYNKKDDTFFMKIRVPYALEKIHGKYCEIKKLTIPTYLHRHLLREVEKHNIKSNEKNALSFRFIKMNNDHQYRVLFTLNKDKKKIITPTNKGVIGVDINNDHFAIVETNQHGQLLSHQSIDYDLANKTKHQREAIIHEKINEIRDLALDKNKPIIIENLNFKQKRQQLYKEKNVDYKRMLSGFAYQKMIDTFTRLMYEYGIFVDKVPPHNSSLLGETLAKDTSLTIHQAAAWVLARRFYQFKEKIKAYFTLSHRSKSFMVYVPSAIHCEHNLIKLRGWLSDVRKYIDGSLSKKKRKVFAEHVFLCVNNNKQILQPVI